MVLNIITEDFENFYDIQDDLGSGQFAVVKRVRELNTGHEFAAKFVRKKKCVAGRRGLKREEILREADILSELAPHRNIITLHDIFENKHEIILVLELVGGGELFHYIAEKDTLSEEEAAKFILQILEGVHHMHEKNIVHLDLKPENVMLLEKNKTQIKIIDFGISRKLQPNEPTKETFGTPEFVAPEVIAFEPVTLATDMWSIGVITYILLSGASPFLGNTNQETFNNITQVDYRFDEEFFANTSDLAKDFIQQLFVKNPRQRATVVDCLNHPWIKPRRRKDEEERRNAQINMPSFKSFIARRRWKVQMHCESRTLRTVTTKKFDKDGNVKSAKVSERKGKTAIYEGQYSETDESDNDIEQIEKQEETNPSKRIHCCPTNIEMRQIKSSEFAESFQQNDEGEENNNDDDDDDEEKHHRRHHQRTDTSVSLIKNPLPNEKIVSDEHSRSQTSDMKVIESIDETTGQNIRTTVQNKVDRDENVKISKSDNIQYEETEEGTLKKVTTKTRKMKKIRCVKAISLCNKIFKQSQLRLSSISSAISLDNLDSNVSGRSYAEDNDDFVLTALLCAAEDGDLANIKKLCNLATIDLNKENKHGETALHFACGAGHIDIVKLLADRKANLTVVDGSGNNAIYWAARQGHVPIITFLHEKGVPINVSNRNGETSLHVAARYGHAHVVENLCKLGSNVDCQDDEEDTPLILAAWHDYSRICRILCGAGADLNIRNKEGETGLICAAQRGNAEIVQILTNNKAHLDIQDKRGLSALHFACKRQQIPIGLTLIHAGCNINIMDNNSETPLHYASREGLLPVVEALTSLGCRMDMKNKADATPLHLAARHGHIEIARFLCLAGLNLSIQDKYGRTACVLAEINGNTEIVQLLKSLSMDNRAVFMEQLVPTKQPLKRIKLKIFGSCDSGKTTLVGSLKCSYLNSFFRRNRLSSTKKNNPNRKSINFDDPEITNINSSKGIGIQQITCTGGGEYSAWDFAGMEIYHSIYDHFIGDFNCIHVLLFNLLDDIQQLEQNLVYWLEFLRVRISVQEPLGHNGRSAQLPKIVLIGTHADLLYDCIKSDDGDYTCERIQIFINHIKNRYIDDFDFYDKIFLLDTRAAWTQSMKNLISCFNQYKERICQNLKSPTIFLDRCTCHIQQQWRKTYGHFPIMPWSRFVECIRQEVNPLASDEHMRELVQQLQIMGEILYLEGDPQEDLICFDPNWLCQTILGGLLSHQRICKRHSSSNETFALNDIRNLFPDISDPIDLLQIFNAYDLCTQIDINGEYEFEFPQLNTIEIMSDLWEKRSGVQYIYIGCEIRSRTLSSLLWSVFPRIQVHLRRLIMSNEFVQHGGGDDVELFQWTEGSKLVVGMIELLLTKNIPTHIELKARGQTQNREKIFYLFHDILSLIEHVFNQMCPMLQIEHHYISTKHLHLNQISTVNTLHLPTSTTKRRYLAPITSLPSIDRDSSLLTPGSPCSTSSIPFAFIEPKVNTSPYYRTYSPKLIVQTLMQQYETNQTSMLDGNNNNNHLTIIKQHHSTDSLNSCYSLTPSKEISPITSIDFDEDLIDLLCCGSNEIFSNLTMGIDLPISIFTLKTRQLLCRLFDKQDKMGRDWCLLAIALQQQHLIPQLDQEDLFQSKTDQLFEELGRKNSSLTIRYFLQKLLDIDRRDAFEVVANTCPIFQFANNNGAAIQPSSNEQDQFDSHDSGIQNSNNTIASLNR
ncbi:unnamed protein product [Rotaria sordida]|uniref:Non-specific serine/threonine protein kinase n=1 Tax=Rotaria sordida TaxID=392033 RepID=A0A813SN04_9BILA|nr:unnamed protein product [Rotaria sordida]CAF0835550.1 unnamed protein product [Rotaria sordida]